MHIHIAGVGGTFMAGVALLARDLGYSVTGSDQRIYPPMSTQLEAQGIALKEGYEPAHLDPAPDLQCALAVGGRVARHDIAQIGDT